MTHQRIYSTQIMWNKAGCILQYVLCKNPALIIYVSVSVYLNCANLSERDAK